MITHKDYEINYANLVKNILDNGEKRKTRNQETRAIFGAQLVIDMSNPTSFMQGYFPLLRGRKMHYNGVIGEMIALLKGPKNVEDFEKEGCNYWKQWAAEPGGCLFDGSEAKGGELELDYGNAWLDFNGVNQIDNLVKTLQENPMDRRMIVSGWRPDRLSELSLPCCHLLYQWFVREGEYLDMIWYQRSVDTMIGLPSDVVLAAVWNIGLARNVGLKPGRITMFLADTHIYEPHVQTAYEYLYRVSKLEKENLPSYVYKPQPGTSLMDMKRSDFLINYDTNIEPLNFEVFA